MDRPVVRFAFPAAVVATVALGLFESITPHQFGVVRAEEKKAEEKKKEEQKKEEVGLGFTCRQRQTQTQPGLAKPIETTTMIRQGPLRDLRMDTYYQGKLDGSTYINYTEGTTITLFHARKTYTRRTGPKGPPPAEQTCDPRPRLQKALAGEHKKLGRQTIEGVEAEGIEVPEVQGGLFGNDGARAKLDSAATQFWSSVETGCPILVEETMVAFNGAIRSAIISAGMSDSIRTSSRPRFHPITNLTRGNQDKVDSEDSGGVRGWALAGHPSLDRKCAGRTPWPLRRLIIETSCG
jgi:hypothetical protein